MLRRVAIWFAAACLIITVQPSGAYEIKPCKGYKGELISVEVHNCPNKTAEHCEIGQRETLSYDIKFKAGTTFKDVAWTGWAWDDTTSMGRNYCYTDPDFCPGKEGDIRAVHYDDNVADTWLPPIGVAMQSKIFSRPEEIPAKGDHYIVCVEFSTKFY